MTTPTPLTAAAIQMISRDDVAYNCARVEALVAQAATAGAQLVVLPEFWPYFGTDAHRRRALAEPLGAGPLQELLAQLAARHRLWLVGGTVPLVANDRRRVRNACLVYAPDGSLSARYDKVHLFRFERGQERYDETVFIEPGEAPVATEIAGWRVALGVCYDLRFPEYWRQMAPFDLMLLPAAFTYTTGQAHWEVLLRARAIENLAYVVASAQGGEHPGGRRTWGHSLIVSPWGEVLARHEYGEGIALAQLDPALLHECRQQLPALQHRVFAVGVS